MGKCESTLKEATDVMNNVIKLERLIKGDPTDYTHHTVSPADEYRAIRDRIEREIESIRLTDDE